MKLVPAGEGRITFRNYAGTLTVSQAVEVGTELIVWACEERHTATEDEISKARAAISAAVEKIEAAGDPTSPSPTTEREDEDPTPTKETNQ